MTARSSMGLMPVRAPGLDGLVERVATGDRWIDPPICVV